MRLAAVKRKRNNGDKEKIGYGILSYLNPIEAHPIGIEQKAGLQRLRARVLVFRINKPVFASGINSGSFLHSTFDIHYSTLKTNVPAFSPSLDPIAIGMG